jgi:hypothetical protein
MAEEKDTKNSEQKTEKSNCTYIDGNIATPFDFGKEVLCRIEKCPYGDNLGEEISYEGEKARRCKIKGTVKEDLLDKINVSDIQNRKGLINILKETFSELKNLSDEYIEKKNLPENDEYEKLVKDYTDKISPLAIRLWKQQGGKGQSPQISYPWEHETKTETYGDLINHIRTDLDFYGLL